MTWPDGEAPRTAFVLIGEGLDERVIRDLFAAFRPCAAHRRAGSRRPRRQSAQSVVARLLAIRRSGPYPKRPSAGLDRLHGDEGMAALAADMGDVEPSERIFASTTRSLAGRSYGERLLGPQGRQRHFNPRRSRLSVGFALLQTAPPSYLPLRQLISSNGRTVS